MACPLNSMFSMSEIEILPWWKKCSYGSSSLTLRLQPSSSHSILKCHLNLSLSLYLNLIMNGSALSIVVPSNGSP